MMKAMTETEKVHITVTYDSGKTISSGCKVDPSKSCSEWLLFNQLLDESHAWENMSSAALEKAKEFVTVE